MFRSPVIPCYGPVPAEQGMGELWAELCEVLIAPTSIGSMQVVPDGTPNEWRDWLNNYSPGVIWEYGRESSPATDLQIHFCAEDLDNTCLPNLWVTNRRMQGPPTVVACQTQDERSSQTLHLGVEVARHWQGRLLILAVGSDAEGETLRLKAQQQMSHLDWRTIPGGVRFEMVNTHSDAVAQIGSQGGQLVFWPEGWDLTADLLKACLDQGTSVLRL